MGGTLARIVPPVRTDDWPPPDAFVAFVAGGAMIEAVAHRDAVTGDVVRTWWLSTDSEEDMRVMAALLVEAYPGAEVRYPPDMPYTGPGEGRGVVTDALRPRNHDAPLVRDGPGAARVAGLSALLAAAQPQVGQSVSFVVAGAAASLRDQERLSKRAGGADGRPILVRALGALLVEFPWALPLIGFVVALPVLARLLDPEAATSDMRVVAWQLAPYATLIAAVGLLLVSIARPRRWGRTPHLSAEAYETKSDRPQDVEFRLIVSDPRMSPRALRRWARQLGGEWLQLSGPDWALCRVRFGRAGLRPRRSRRALLSAREVGVLFPGPAPVRPGSGIEHVGTPARVPAAGQMGEGVLVGHTDRARTREVRQSPGLLRRHQVVHGASGTGKSTMLRHLAERVMQEHGQALVLVDPVADLAETVLGLVPPQSADRAVYIDLSPSEHLPTINLLDAHVYPDVDLQVGRALELIRLSNPAETWGNRQASIFRQAVTALMKHNQRQSRTEQHTVLDVLEFVGEQKVRARVHANCGDPKLARDWALDFGGVAPREFASWRQSLNNKIQPLRRNRHTNHLLGNPASTIDLSDVLAGRIDVVIVNGASAQLGRDAAQLLCGAIVNLLLQVMETQADRPPHMRRDVGLIVDEAALLAPVDYVGAYARARRLGLSIITAAQHLALLDDIDPNLAPVVLGSSAALTVYGTGAEDARRLAPELGVPAEDIVSLDRYRAIARWEIDDLKQPAVTFWGRAAAGPSREQEALADDIRNRSRSLYYTRLAAEDPRPRSPGATRS